MINVIKFRAWDKERKKIFQVFEIDFKNNQVWCGITQDAGNILGGCYAGDRLKIYCSLDKAELMQCTGLKDKNGKEIYEGDIVRFEDTGEEGYEYKEGYDFKNAARVIFDEERAMFTLTDFVQDDCFVENDGLQEDGFAKVLQDCEVIGNIYENPELLKNGK